MKHLLLNIWTAHKKTKQTTAFNIIGLSISFAAFVLLFVYLWNEFTFDRYNKNVDQIYLLEIRTSEGDDSNSTYRLPNPMADYFAQNIPEMETVCSFAWGPGTYSIRKGGTQGIDITTRAVDSTFAEMFDLKMKYGSTKTLYSNNTILLSEESAQKLFKDENPVGKVIYGNFSAPYTVEGVFYNLPQNSSFYEYKAFCSYPTTSWINDWSEYSFNHYYQLPKGVSVAGVVEKMNNSQGVNDWKQNSLSDYSFHLVPSKNLHFNTRMGTGNLLFARTLVLVAVLLLFMAFVNYLNFAIANSPKLRRVTNIRQVLGESRKRLFVSAILDSVFMVSIAFIFCFVFCLILLRFWPNILSYQFNLGNYLWLLGLSWLLFLVIGAAVSIFPASLNISETPAMALNGLFKGGKQKNSLRNVLTVIQFGVSILLVIAVLLINKQVDFFKNYNLGFEKENIIVVKVPSSIKKQEKAFMDELNKNASVIDYAFSQFVPGGVGMGWGRDIDGKNISFKCWPVDERYMRFMGFEVIEGRGFSDNLEADQNKFIMNQTALKEFEWNEGYLGKQIPGFGFKGELIGVVKDMKYASLHEEVEPLAFWLTETRHNSLSIKISGQNVRNTIQHITEVYNTFEKSFPISYQFLDERLDAMYKTEEKQAELISIFCLVSIIISIVGILGLAILFSEYRVKEIGIRKVNGAKIIEIIAMLNSAFIKSILIAFVIACPLAYYAMNKWLENFAYKTTLSWWIFALAGVLALGIALLTVSFQSYKAATRNPIESLRYE